VHGLDAAALVQQQAAFADRRHVGGTADQRHRMAGARQHGAVVAAHRPGAHHRDRGLAGLRHSPTLCMARHGPRDVQA
jgi:hypothetical protein